MFRFFKYSCVKIFKKRPSISDQIKVGFYSTDRFTQTDETEILILKNATQNLELMSKVSLFDFLLLFFFILINHSFRLKIKM